MIITPLRLEESAARQPPHNTEAEQTLLGALLIDNPKFHRVSA
jgi:hypothetical protein